MLKRNGRRSSRKTGEVGFWRGGQNTGSCGMSSFWSTRTGFVIDLRQQLTRNYRHQLPRIPWHVVLRGIRNAVRINFSRKNLGTNASKEGFGQNLGRCKSRQM